MINKGQTILEYTIIIAVVVAALLGMRTYYKRSVMGRLRAQADQIGEGSIGYSPRGTTSTSLAKRIFIENSSSYSEDGTGGGFKNSISESNTSIRMNTSLTAEVLSNADENSI